MYVVNTAKIITVINITNALLSTTIGGVSFGRGYLHHRCVRNAEKSSYVHHRCVHKLHMVPYVHHRCVY